MEIITFKNKKKGKQEKWLKTIGWLMILCRPLRAPSSLVASHVGTQGEGRRHIVDITMVELLEINATKTAAIKECP
jgi:hypothetical protein